MGILNKLLLDFSMHRLPGTHERYMGENQVNFGPDRSGFDHDSVCITFLFGSETHKIEV